MGKRPFTFYLPCPPTQPKNTACHSVTTSASPSIYCDSLSLRHHTETFLHIVLCHNLHPFKYCLMYLLFNSSICRPTSTYCLHVALIMLLACFFVSIVQHCTFVFVVLSTLDIQSVLCSFSQVTIKEKGVVRKQKLKGEGKRM